MAPLAVHPAHAKQEALNAMGKAVDGVAQAVALRDLFDGGPGDGYLEFLTAADAVIAVLTFDTISFTESGGVLTMAGAPKATAGAVAAGTITKFRIYDSIATQYIEGTVGLTSSGDDIELSSVVAALSETFNITSFTITDPAT